MAFSDSAACVAPMWSRREPRAYSARCGRTRCHVESVCRWLRRARFRRRGASRAKVRDGASLSKRRVCAWLVGVTLRWRFWCRKMHESHETSGLWEFAPNCAALAQGVRCSPRARSFDRCYGRPGVGAHPPVRRCTACSRHRGSWSSCDTPSRFEGRPHAGRGSSSGSLYTVLLKKLSGAWSWMCVGGAWDLRCGHLLARI